jgi:hypothetical protein
MDHAADIPCGVVSASSIPPEIVSKRVWPSNEKGVLHFTQLATVGGFSALHSGHCIDRDSTTPKHIQLWDFVKEIQAAFEKSGLNRPGWFYRTAFTQTIPSFRNAGVIRRWKSLLHLLSTQQAMRDRCDSRSRSVCPDL